MITIEIDDKSPQAKKVIDLLNTFDFVQIVKDKNKLVKNGKYSKINRESDSPYNFDFVKMVKNAEKGKRLKISSSNLWESIL